MTIESAKQGDLFLDNDPEARDKYERTKFRISILGGNKSESLASELGYQLTQGFFSVQTGGYKYGAMKGALEGADQALAEMDANPSLSLFTKGQARPVIAGITANKFNPFEEATSGEHIKIKPAANLYQRLETLIEAADVVVVFPGDTGTELEAMAGLHFDQKLKRLFDVGIPKKLIFVGDGLQGLVEKFSSVSGISDTVATVSTIGEAQNLIEKIYSQVQGKQSRDI